MDVLQGDMRRRGASGAAAELIVCANLLRRGWHVFRAESPHCPCDLIAMTEDGTCLRVEVRSANYYAPTGNVSITVKPSDRFDVMAVVLEDKIGYLGVGFPLADFPWPIREACYNQIMERAGKPA